MRKSERESGTRARIAHLEKRHGSLEGAILELDAHRYLTDAEQSRIQQLKREKLATKDELTDLRRHV
jgi:hypothetical protein